MRPQSIYLALALVLGVMMLALLSSEQECCAQPMLPSSGLAELEARLAAQEAELRELREQVESQQPVYGRVESSSEVSCGCAPPVRRLPVVMETPCEPSCSTTCGEGWCRGYQFDDEVMRGGYDCGDESYHLLHFYTDYDSGFVIRPVDPKQHPYELKIGGRIQYRYHAFDRDVTSWTDNAGVTRPVNDKNQWDIERARLTFGGYVLDERLSFYMQIDGDTDGAEALDFLDYWFAWEFSDSFELQMGKRKMPAVRQWLLSSKDTRLIDRPMACDFFRPDRSTGVCGVGKIGERVHYEVMCGNGYDTANLPSSGVDDRLSLAATSYWDPTGDYGSEIVDYDWSCDPLFRIGQSFVYSPQAAVPGGSSVNEVSFLRLTDGTQVVETGALTPGVTVSQFDIILYGVDAALKWQGWSINAEAFLRWIEDIEGNGALTVTDLYQHGFYVEGGKFLIEKKLDFNLRYSQIDGDFGHSSEYAGGFNWYPYDTKKIKISCDATHLDGSPLNNTSSNILVGDDGMLYRAQFQAYF